MTTAISKQAESILTGRREHDRGLRNRPRRTGLLAFAGLMIASSALAGAVLFASAGDTVEVLAAREAIAKGHIITQDDLVAKDVSGIDDAIDVDDSGRLVGATAVVDLLPGQVFADAMVSKSPIPGPGKATVGLNLAAARAPSAGLVPGDLVDVIAVPAEGNAANDTDALDAPPILASDAQVYDVKGSATEGGGVLVTLIVDEFVAARLAAYSTAARVALVETPPSGEGTP